MFSLEGMPVPLRCPKCEGKLVVLRYDPYLKVLKEGILKYAWRADPFRTHEPMTIGTYNREGWGDFWNGGLCDLRIYKKELSVDEMQYLGQPAYNARRFV